MKFVSTVLLVFICLTGFSNPAYQKLCDVNKLWLEQKDIDQGNLAILEPRTETEWIQLHLSLVEKTLRSRNTNSLSESQKQNRSVALDELHNYWQAARFPQNEEYSYRLPIFIDKYDNFCAVGYLVKATGYEHVSRMISAQTNLAYVREMKYPELLAWANDYGFTIDELAWIQPTYPPICTIDPLAKGTDGIVNELFTDASGQKLYVGGNFSKVGNGLTANNIAYVTESKGTFTWNRLAGGVDGPVSAIAEFDNKIFVAGQFHNAGGTPVYGIACWDGAAWHNAGCLGGQGIVKDLIVFKGNLYATGSFDVCAALNQVNLAQWNGSGWQQIPVLEGRINTAEVFGDHIVLGGAFTLNNEKINVAKWRMNEGYQKFDNTIADEVMDFEVYKDTLYAVCKQVAADKANLYLRLEGNSWKAMPDMGFYNDSISINTLCVNDDRLLMGGYFQGGMMISINNCVDATPFYYPSSKGGGYWFLVNDVVNKMVNFKNYLVAGGDFTFSDGNGIGYMATATSIEEINGKANTFKIFPNPTNSSSILNIESSVDGNLMLRDISGKLLLKERVGGKFVNITLPALRSGLYMVELVDEEGQKRAQKLLVQ